MSGIINKKNIIITSLIIIILLGIIVGLYGTFAFSNIDNISYEKANKIFKLIIDNVDNNTYSTTVSKNDSKDLNIVIQNYEGIDLNYSLFYSGVLKDANIEVGLLESSENKSSGVIEKKSTHNVKLRITNNTNTDVSINIGIIYGYVKGGDLIIDADKYPIDKEIKDTKNLNSSGANSPKIVDEMIPVYYDEYDHNWKKADETNVDQSTMWYNYQDKKWANIILKNTNRIIDLSNNLNNATNVGANWDKENGYITTSNSGYVDCGLQNYYFGNKISIILRFKMNNLSNSDQLLIGNWKNNAGGGLAYSIVDGTTYLNSNFYFSDIDDSIIVKSDTSVAANTWYTVVVTYDATNQENDNFKLYLNGKLVGSTKASGSITISDQTVTIGSHSDITVSDALIFNNSLTEEDIKSYYSENISVNDSRDLIMYYNFMDGIDIPNGTVISDKYQDGSLAFFTWIPRYKYKVWNIEKISSQYSYAEDNGNLYDAYNKGIDIAWESGTDTTGTIKCNYSINNSPERLFVNDYTNNLTLSETCTGSNGEYYTHPAFDFDGDITGFWISKFETSGNLEEPHSLPDNISITTSNIADSFNSALTLTENNVYGITDQNLTSHLIKNIEWGAVAYLTHSSYGICDGYSCNDININNSTDGYTGRSSGKDINSGEVNTNKYGNFSYKGYTINEETGELKNNIISNSVASTTGNVYGVYDLAGGKSEYVMSVLSSINGTLPASATSYLNNMDSKYFDLYSYGEEYNTQTSYNRSILGDATGEIVLTDSIEKGLWYNHHNYFLNSFSELLTRGGQTSAIENSGLFTFEAISGYSTENYSYRITIS